MRPCRRRMSRPLLAALALLAVPHGAAADPAAARARLPALVRLSPDGVAALRRDAGAGHAGAMVLLGEAYGFGFGGLPADDRMAVEWLDRAARAGDPGAAREADFFAFRARNAALIADGALAMDNARRIVAGQPPLHADGAEQPPWTQPDPALMRLASLGTIAPYSTASLHRNCYATLVRALSHPDCRAICCW